MRRHASRRRRTAPGHRRQAGHADRRPARSQPCPAQPRRYPACPHPRFACGYEDGNDLDHLRGDPGFKLACGRLPESGGDLCSQPTVSRWENAPTRHEVAAMSYAMIDIYCASYARPPREVTLDIDDSVDVVPGAQQLSLFNTHYGERCFLPMHVYETATGRPVAVLLRSGKTPSGGGVAGQIRRRVRRIRMHWPATKITIRGDSHYGRHEAMALRPRCGRLTLGSLRDGARPTASITFSASAACRCWTEWWEPPPTMCGCAGPKANCRWGGGMSRRAAARPRGNASGGWPRASRRAPTASIFDTWSPTSDAVARSGFTTLSIASAVRPR